MMPLLASLLLFSSVAFVNVKGTEWPAVDILASNASSQIRHFSPLDNAVLGPLLSQESTFDPDALEKGPEPEFHVFADEFGALLGENARVRRVAHVDGFAFAHEAPVWIKATNEVFFASNAGGDLGYSGLNASNRVFKIGLNNIPQDGAQVNLTAEWIPLSEDLQMVNGGAPYEGSILFMCEGRGDKPSELTLMHPYPPYNTTVLLDNYYGRQFNSVNDVAVHPKSKALFFTDPTYGFTQDFRSEQYMRIQTYRYDPSNGDLRAVADQNPKPNGIAFSPDLKKAYISDTGVVGRKEDVARPASIYQYDVEIAGDGTEQLATPRLFAYISNGAPDGIKVDTKGNVYAGCGDGVHVFSPYGKFLGKIYLGQTSANLAFVENGLIILAETDIYYAEIQAKGVDIDFWSA